MKKLIAGVFFLVCTGCATGDNRDKTYDSASITSTPGNSAGSNTIAEDTARLDTGLGHIQSDNAK